MAEKKYTYQEFLDIVKALRGEKGCPWDKAQTHMTLRPCMTEEAAEVLAAIRILEQTGNGENLAEELGDVLLQVVMHAQIAEEEGLFTVEDVVSGIAEKMVRRHPHVFGGDVSENAGQALESWEEIKKKEKEGKSFTGSPLGEIPRELPALTRAEKVIKKADRLCRSQPDFAETVLRIQESCAKLAACRPEAYSRDIADLTGEILFSLSRIAGSCKLSQEQILTDRIDDFTESFEKECFSGAKIQ